jgi:acid phosphatase family membrane protein YuiD
MYTTGADSGQCPFCGALDKKPLLMEHKIMTAVSAIKSLFENIIFLSTVTSLCIAQILKMVFYFLTHKNKKKKDVIETILWRTGGMPSSHSAVVCYLATSAGIREGVNSNFFIFCLVFAMVVLRDSVGVRRAAGMQAKALNNLGRQSAEKTGIVFRSVKEIQGHTPLEVFVGASLGVVIAIIFHLARLSWVNQNQPVSAIVTAIFHLV